MQFYIIHPTPAISVKLLPDYALKQVNLREGYQILSDIGHIVDVHWPNQNKLYSISHALTRSFCSSIGAFNEFVINYDHCCREYYNRFGKMIRYMDLFSDWLDGNYFDLIVDKLPEDRYSSVIQYLTTVKRDKLTADEIDSLTSTEIAKLAKEYYGTSTTRGI